MVCVPTCNHAGEALPVRRRHIGRTVCRSAPWIFFAYVVLNIAYSLGLKHVVILDVFIIAAGTVNSCALHTVSAETLAVRGMRNLIL